jgi:hypothetical protein
MPVHAAALCAVPHSSRLYRDEWAAAQSSRPLRLDFHHASNPGGVVVETAPAVFFRGADQSAFDRVSMDVPDHLGAFFFSTHVAVVVALLPEVFAIAFQASGGLLLQGFQPLCKQDGRRLVDEQMDVLRHQDVGIDPGLMPEAKLLDRRLDEVFGLRGMQERQTVEATEGEEVKRLGLLESLETGGHGDQNNPRRPLIAIRPR